MGTRALLVYTEESRLKLLARYGETTMSPFGSVDVKEYSNGQWGNNPKVSGSNPDPATNATEENRYLATSFAYPNVINSMNERLLSRITFLCNSSDTPSLQMRATVASDDNFEERSKCTQGALGVMRCAPCILPPEYLI
jgi:hypothetical protein